MRREHRNVHRWLSCLLSTTALLLPVMARAETPDATTDSESDDGASEEEPLGPRSNLRTRAESIRFDPRQRTLELDGNVRVDSPPFHLRSDSIRLERTRFGVELDGKGNLAFCPCLGTPLRIDFDHVIVAPPGDLILRSPLLRVYGVPILYLPYFWLRSTEKPGLLPPDIAYRGQDGVYLGGGVHLPWHAYKDDPDRYAVDLRAGVYLAGGFATDVRVQTPSSVTKVRFDRRVSASAPAAPSDVASDPESESEGLRIDARGSTRTHDASMAWDVDALRGRRGLVSTTELTEAAKPWDRAAIEPALRGGSFSVSTTLRALSRRGTSLSTIDAFGPAVRARTSGALSRGITYDVTTEGGSLRVANGDELPTLVAPTTIDTTSARTLSFVRAEVGVTGATVFGPISATVSGRATGGLASFADRSGVDRAASAQTRWSLPLVRSYGSKESVLVHVLEPFAQASVLNAESEGLFGYALGRAVSAVSGTAPVVSLGVASSLGRPRSNTSVDAELATGLALGDVADARPLGRGRVSATTTWFGASFDGGSVLGASADRTGWVVVARGRLGQSNGLRLLLNVATREGIDPVLARTLSNAPLEPSSGFLSWEGTTGGAGLVVPWSRVLTTSAGADADASEPTLIAARGGFELHDRCGCVTLRASGSRRIGRGGFDAWLALEFASDR